MYKYIFLKINTIISNSWITEYRNSGLLPSQNASLQCWTKGRFFWILFTYKIKKKNISIAHIGVSSLKIAKTEIFFENLLLKICKNLKESTVISKILACSRQLEPRWKTKNDIVHPHSKLLYTIALYCTSIIFKQRRL